jgi:hypothetical protein
VWKHASERNTQNCFLYRLLPTVVVSVFGKRLFRNIEDGDDLKTPIKKRFDPPRCAAADINNRRGSFDARCMNEIEGDG